MSRKVTVAAIQYAPGLAKDSFAEAEALVREAASQGAQVILLPELFEGPYFCKTQEEEHFAMAQPWQTHPVVTRFAPLAKELGVVLPLSIFEREGPHTYNSLVCVDADGELLGVYRKSHIPDGPGYQEKYYFRPGNTGFKVWATKFGKIGVGICWDQWFPEAARAMALQGAELLFYPTAIGAEPQAPEMDTAARWRRGMQGHAVANTMPVIAANRFGDEDGQVFYGTSFIADQTGEIVTDLNRTETGVITASFDLDELATERSAWGLFRDRRPELYSPLTS
ncbi:N-carbamoylputrescine amidase [Parvularcula marina]|uniref:N-carbamoylputrescine amidase n=1 Tax=Parvularcula marina TaxID=2292771 RepID=A0A371RIP7_9PROT|nr:N-carbamoylputrescine amidase [Parvularcula marina]RFB05310.1 N-carbamoylputrescine amidase [Parvularcula marina]